MLFTATSPAHQGDRILLFPRRADAGDAADPGGPIFAVCVHFDGVSRRIIPAEGRKSAVDPTWSAPAYLVNPRAIIARGPLPAELYRIREPVPDAESTNPPIWWPTAPDDAATAATPIVVAAPDRC